MKTFGEIMYADGKWALRGLPPHVSLRFKSMFKKVRTTDAGSFLLTDSPEVCADLLWFFQRYPVLGKARDLHRLEHGETEAQARLEFADTVLAADWKPSLNPVFRPDRPPYLYQSQAAAICLKHGRLLLMDDVGLGKTVSALVTIAEAGVGPAAVIVEAHLAMQWARKIKEFTSLTVHVIDGTTPYRLPRADICVFKYSNIVGWVDIAATGFFKVVVFDEIQQMRTGNAAAKGVAGKRFSDNARIRLALSATPVFNYGPEIFNIVERLEPGVLGSWEEFVIEWCERHGNHWKVKNPDALGSYLRSISMTLKRTEEEVESHLPPLNILMHHVPYDEDVVAGIEAEAQTLALKVLHGSFTESGQAARELDMMARHATGVAKAKPVAAFVRMLVESGERVLLGAWHRDCYAIWNKELKDLDPVMFTGSETTKAKDRSTQAFIKGDSGVLMMSLRSGSGIDGLQEACATAVAAELDWSPQVHKQFFGRLRRPGQYRQVTGIYVVTNGGSDPVLIEMNGLKAAQAQGITDPLAGPKQSFSDDSRIKKLAQSYLERAGA